MQIHCQYLVGVCKRGEENGDREALSLLSIVHAGIHTYALKINMCIYIHNVYRYTELLTMYHVCAKQFYMNVFILFSQGPLRQ